MNVNIPKVAIVGRPNVGKSSIYNRIIGRRESIIDATPGVTRNRHYHLVQTKSYNFYLTDTGGITIEENDQFADAIKIQSEIAITEADLILFVIEVSCLTEDDYTIAELLRKSDKPILLIVNKCDNVNLEYNSVTGYELNLGKPIPISAIHGIHIHNLLDTICNHIPKAEITEEVSNKIRVSIVGRPNVGKSSLLNKILNEERSLVTDIPGTTRDSIMETKEFMNYQLEFLDTAGLRRKSRVTDDVEYYSVNRAIKSIERSDVAVHLIDSLDHLTDQDKKIIGVAINRGKAVIIGVNKWDLLEESTDFKVYLDRLRFRFAIAAHVPVINLSALTGMQVDKLLKMVIDIYKQFNYRIETKELNDLLNMAQQRYTPSGKRGKLKIYYGTQISTAPPKFLLFVNRKDLLTKNYTSYLTGQIRNIFGFEGVPIFIYTRNHR